MLSVASLAFAEPFIDAVCVAIDIVAPHFVAVALVRRICPSHGESDGLFFAIVDAVEIAILHCDAFNLGLGDAQRQCCRQPNGICIGQSVGYVVAIADGEHIGRRHSQCLWQWLAVGLARCDDICRADTQPYADVQCLTDRFAIIAAVGELLVIIDWQWLAVDVKKLRRQPVAISVAVSLGQLDAFKLKHQPLGQHHHAVSISQPEWHSVGVAKPDVHFSGVGAAAVQWQCFNFWLGISLALGLCVEHLHCRGCHRIGLALPQRYASYVGGSAADRRCHG